MLQQPIKFSDHPRLANIIRVALSPIFIFYSMNFYLRVFLYFGIVHFVFSLAWFVLSEKNLLDEKRFPFAPYAPRILDSLIITLFVCITGHANSFGVIVYALLVLLGSLYPEKNWGFFSMILCVSLYFVSGLLIMVRVFPLVNVLGYVTPVTWRELIVSTMLIGLTLYLTTTIVHPLTAKRR